jgi:flagellar basal-body rod protein FlgF
MDPLTISAASGMRARLESLDMLANNLANSATPGFKLDRESYNLYVAQESVSPESPDPSRLPVVERHWTDFTQGHLTSTGSPLDFALGSRGFFAVDGPGGALYTRNGGFRLSPTGVLETTDGFAVRASGGGTVTLEADKSFEVAPDGSVKQNGTVAATLEVDDFANPGALAKFGRSYFQAGEDAGMHPASSVQVHQGKLESSNVEGPESAVRLVSILRQFEMLHKAISLGQDMGRRAIEEVAKV